MHVDNINEESNTLLSSLQKLENLSLQASPGVQDELSLTVKTNRDIDYIAVFDLSGQLIWSASDEKIPHKIDFATLKDVTLTPQSATMAESVPGAIDMRFASNIVINGKTAGKLVTGKFLFDDSFITALKSALSVEFSVICGDTRYSTTLKDSNGQSLVGTKVTNQEVLTRVLNNGEVFKVQSDIFGQAYNTLYWPISDPDKIIGMLFIGEATSTIEQTQRHFLLSVVSILAVILILLLVVIRIVVGSIGKSLNNIMTELNHSFEQVNHCSADILRSSETLSQGAHEQSSSLQDTAAALVEMMTMTKQSAENSTLTKNTNIETNKLIKDGVKLTENMMEAMSQIETSARRIEAIIKTIDDIAFQTNLLALNAAVEAARAGEAGAGFAVVADEVRNLSLRSSEAAKNTNELITTSVDRVTFGVKIVNELDGCFKKIENGADMVSDLIDQISVATSEQSHGATLAEQAVESTSRVAERNAQEASSAARASQSLNDAAQNLEAAITNLGGVIGGKKAASQNLLVYKNNHS
jgi:methyl-accepting chemotaxis protein